MPERVKIVCSEAEEVEIDLEIVKHSVRIMDLIEEFGTEEKIPLPGLSLPIFEKVIVFCTYLQNHAPPEIEKPLRSVDMKALVAIWYADYIDVEK